MKALVTAKFPEKYYDQLYEIVSEASFAGRGHTGYKLTAEEMIPAIGDAELVIDGIEEINGKVMDACKNLKIIVCCRNEAFASIDIKAATERGIPVISAVGRNAVSVAEFTMGLLLAVCKNISNTDYLLRHTDKLAGKTYRDKPEHEKNPTGTTPPSFWSTDPTGPSAIYGNYPELFGKKFGQIGYGSIGREVAKRAQGFGMELLVCDPYQDPDEIAKIGATLVDLPTLMKESDFISINCNVTPSTVNLVSREMLSLMKPTAYIVNTARAPIMDYDALCDMLEQKKIAGAALDVFPQEPIAKGDRILSFENVVLTPHLAGQAREIGDHQVLIVMENLRMLLRGERPKTICNPEVLDSWFKKYPELLILKK